MVRANVKDQDISFVVKFALVMLDCLSRGIPYERVDTHLLQAGWAFTMKLSGCNDSRINKQGRWSLKSMTFLEYTQNQFLMFTEEIAHRMSQIKMFMNMEGNRKREDLCHLMNVNISRKRC